MADRESSLNAAQVRGMWNCSARFIQVLEGLCVAQGWCCFASPFWLNRSSVIFEFQVSDDDDDDDELYYSLNCLIARHTCFANRAIHLPGIMGIMKDVLSGFEKPENKAKFKEKER